MLIRASHILKYQVYEAGINIGIVYDLHFDDRTWEILHYGVNKSHLLKTDVVTSRLNEDIEIDYVKRRFFTGKLEPVWDNPIMHSDYELTQTFAWPNLWSISESEENGEISERQNHLRSLREVTGYYVKNNDQTILGYVIDFIIDSNEMQIVSLIIRKSKFLPIGKKITLDINVLSFIPNKTEILYNRISE